MAELNSSELKQLATKAVRHVEQEQLADALKIAELVGTVDTDDLDVLAHLGQMELLLDRSEPAIEYYSKAHTLQPDNSHYAYSLACAYSLAGRDEESAAMLRSAIEANPDQPAPISRLGSYLLSTGKHAEAADLLLRAVELKSGSPEPYHDLVLSLRLIGRHEEAVSYARKLIRLQPSAQNHILLAGTLIESGQQDDAVQHINKAIRADKTCGLAYFNLAAIKKYSAEDESKINKIEKVLDGSMSAHDRALIHFSLGKIYDDCGQWDKAFSNYEKANVLDRVATEPDAQRKYYKSLSKNLTGKILSQLTDLGSSSEKPVFVVGMPRSGTTLIEQIISRHPQADGAGELLKMTQIGQQILGDGDVSTAEFRSNLSEEKLTDYAREYLSELERNCCESLRIVDKMPGNFLNLGLIHLLFPRARIIHVIRHPLDVCLSCYFQAFQGVEMSYDLDWIANQYILYRKAMDHWKSVLPDNAIVDVHYEQIIDDTEPAIRQLIDACGLDWDPVCMEAGESGRAIVTASYVQAQQPLYTTSRRRWVNYASHLAGVAKRLREYLDPDELDEFSRQGISIGSGWKQKLFGC